MLLSNWSWQTILSLPTTRVHQWQPIIVVTNLKMHFNFSVQTQSIAECSSENKTALYTLTLSQERAFRAQQKFFPDPLQIMMHNSASAARVMVPDSHSPFWLAILVNLVKSVSSACLTCSTHKPTNWMAVVDDRSWHLKGSPLCQ